MIIMTSPGITWLTTVEINPDSQLATDPEDR